MAKRNVYPTTEIAHLWFHQTQDSARNPQRNLYFNGSTIYSYRDSYPIGRLVSNAQGERGVLVQENKYGNTTARHIGLVRRAIPYSVQVFTVPGLMTGSNDRASAYDHAHNLEWYGKQLQKRELESKRARSNAGWKGERLQKLLTEANQYARFFALDRVFELTDADTLAGIIKAHKEVARKENAAKLAKIMADVDKWVKGESNWFPSSVRDVYLRIERDEMVTSRGARIPLDHARKGLAFIRKVRESGVEYVRNGHTLHLGHYAIDRIDAYGNLTAGCHYIAYSEIERIAPMLEASKVEGVEICL